MNRSILFISFLALTTLAFGQKLNFQPGISISSLNWRLNNQDLILYDETMIGSSILVGMEIYNSNFFAIGSNIGILRKGGKETAKILNSDGEFVDGPIKTSYLDYLTLNSVFEFKFPIRNIIIPFIQCGPRVDFLINHGSSFDGLNDLGFLKKLNWGLILTGGLNFELSHVNIGVSTSYYHNFNEIANWPAQPNNIGGKITDNTFVVSLTIGYSIYKKESN